MPARPISCPVADPVARPLVRSRWRSPVDDGGQTTVLVALVVAFALVMLVGIARLGAVAIDRAQARTAADAAALAAAVDEPVGGGAGRRAAAEVARRNGAELTGYEADGSTVEVTVEVDGVPASARAERFVATGP